MSLKRTCPTLYDALESTGLPWNMERGGRHLKVLVAGRLAGVIADHRGREGRSTATKNVIAQIRRIARQCASPQDPSPASESTTTR